MARRNFVRIRSSPVGHVYHLRGWGRAFRCLLVVLIGIALQGVWASRMRIGFAEPDFGLVILSCLALLTDPSSGAWIGFFVGLMQGAMLAQTLGSYILSRTIAGFAIGWIPVRLERAHPLMPVLAAMLLVFMAESLLFLMAPRGEWFERGLCLVGKALYNGALAFPLYYLLRRWIPSEPE